MNSSEQELSLVAASIAWERELLAYRRECMAQDDGIHGGSRLESFDSIAQWLVFLSLRACPQTLPSGYVPDSTYLLADVRQGRMLGIVNIRHQLNDHLLRFGGHIGYSIRPCERGKGLGKVQLRLALEKCRNLGLHRVLLICNDENMASRRTIESCGGVYEDSRQEASGTWVRRYWIDISN